MGQPVSPMRWSMPSHFVDEGLAKATDSCFLTFAQHVHGEVLRRQIGPHGIGETPEAPQDERRVERHGIEGIDGVADELAAVVAVVMTVTPVRKEPMECRNSFGSMVMAFLGAALFVTVVDSSELAIHPSFAKQSSQFLDFTHCSA